MRRSVGQPDNRPRRRIRAIAFPILLAAGVVAAVLLWPWIRSAIDSLEQLGPWGVPVLLAVQILQVVLFIIPGEVVQIAAGYLFGVAGGSAISLAGIVIGSLINYVLGGVLGAPFLDMVTSPGLRERIHATAQRRGIRIGFYLLFVIPGIPKDVLGYVAGAVATEGWGAAAGTATNTTGSGIDRSPGEVSRRGAGGDPAAVDLGAAQFVGRHDLFGVGPFLLLSMFGRSPGILGSAMIGASAAAGYGAVAITLFLVSTGIMVVAIRFQGEIEDRVASLIHRLLR